jgi:CheY-like chemotaxis protein
MSILELPVGIRHGGAGRILVFCIIAKPAGHKCRKRRRNPRHFPGMAGAARADNSMRKHYIVRNSAPKNRMHPFDVQVLKTASPAGRRLLVADDNPLNRQMTARLLEKLGCRVDVAADGLEALALHHAMPYDLILMDCEMPQLNGFDTTRRIRAITGAARTVPVIALTALTAPEERERCLAAGMDEVLHKPVSLKALQDLLRDLSPAQPAPAAEADRLDAVHAAFGADFAGLAALYRNDSPPRIAALRAAAAAQDAAGIAQLAHVFGGSCAAIGAPRLAALCRDLEIQARAGTLTQADQAIAAIDAEYHRIAMRLQAMLGLQAASSPSPAPRA